MCYIVENECYIFIMKFLNVINSEHSVRVVCMNLSEMMSSNENDSISSGT